MGIRRLLEFIESMKVLLDTHILIWFVHDQQRLSKNVVDILSDYRNKIYISSISFIEIALRLKDKNLKMKLTLKELIKKSEKEFNFSTLQLQSKHALTFNEMTFNRKHKDPFDHILISQAISDKLTIISDDIKFPFYTTQGLYLIEN